MSLFHRCPHCGKYSITLDALQFHLTYAHGVQLVTPAQPQPLPQPRRCLICAGDTCGVDALCGECQHKPQDERLTDLQWMADIGEFSDWETDEVSHAIHMMDENEPPRTHWYAVVAALVAHHGFVLDDGAGYGE